MTTSIHHSTTTSIMTLTNMDNNNIEQLKDNIREYIKQNGNKEITGQILQDVLLGMVDGLVGNDAVANPDGEAVEILEKIGIAGNKYSIPKGTEVEANPTGEAAIPLNKIKIVDTNYNIPQTDISVLATKQEVQQGLSEKQDTISDLQQIRTRADEGHTALQPIQDATPNNFVIFDENGGIKDSGKKDTDFATAAQGTKADNAIPMPTGTDGQILEKDSNETSGVKWVNKPSDGQDGASAYELYEQAEIAAGRTPLSQEAWLASLKANIGEFLFVPTDATAVTAMATIGQTYSSAIDPLGKNVAPSQNTLSVILLMNDDATTPTKTMMIATQDDGSSGFEFVYAGDLQSAMPSNVLTETDIDDTHLVNPTDSDVASAKDVMQLKAKLEGVTLEETKVPVVTSGTGQNTYDGYINGINGTYASSSYNSFIVVELGTNTRVRWLAKENASNSSNIGWAFGTFSGEIDATLSNFTALSSGVYANNPSDNQAVEYIKDAPEGATHAVITIWKYRTGGGSAVTLDNFYCYCESGKTIVGIIANKVDVDYDKEPVDYLSYVIPATNNYIVTSSSSTSYGKAVYYSSADTYGVTDFIPVANIKCLYCNNTVNKSSGNTTFAQGCVYNASREPIRYIGSSLASEIGQYYIKQDGDAYVRWTIKSREDLIIREVPIHEDDSPISGYAAKVLSKDAFVGGKNLFKKSYGKNLCNPDEITSKQGLYIATPSGALGYSSSSVSSYGLTGFIPMNGKTLVCNKGYYFYNVVGCATYDEDFHLVQTYNSNTATYTPAGDGVKESKYARFTLNSVTDVQVEQGSISTEYEPYSESVVINENMIPKDDSPHTVTVDDITPNEVILIGTNLCNPDEISSGHAYINASNGKEVPYSTLYTTGYIPIDDRGLYCALSYRGGTSIGYAFYSDKNTESYLGGYYKNHFPAGCSQWHAVPIQGAKYVRFTISSKTNVMVNVGNTELPYEPYQGYKKVISKDILPDFEGGSNNEYEAGVDIVLPSTIYCTKGDTLYLYWRSFIEAVNPKAFDCCSPNPSTVENVLSYPDCLKIKKTVDATIKISVRDSALKDVVSKDINFKAVNIPTSPASALNILLVGASREANGVTPLEVYRRLVGDNSMTPNGLGLTNINFVGRKGCKVYDCEQLGYPSSLYSQVKHEAVSGKKIHDMVVAGDTVGYTFYYEPNPDYVFNQGDTYSDGTRTYTVVGSDSEAGDLQVTIASGSGSPSATGILTLTNGSGTESVSYISYENETSNPFWNSTTGKIDFSKYATDYCGGATIGVLVLCRILNDLWNNRTPEQVVADYDTVIEAFHEYNSSGYVIINLGVLSSMYGGLPHSYTKGTPLTTAWYAARKILETHKLLINLAEDDNYKDFCLLSNSNAEFDLDYFYSKEAVQIRNRGTSKTVQYDNNGLHFNAIGKQVVADSIYHCVCKIINDING